jgi:HAD superfamily hydrolase (TIGR01509 family)
MSTSAGDCPWILFDFDGTLVDTLELLRNVYETFLENHGSKGSNTEFAALNGSCLQEIVARLRTAHLIRGNIHCLTKEYSELLTEASCDVQPMPGATDLILSFHPHVAMVTAGRSADVVPLLHRLGWQFEVLVTGDRVSRGKPHPDPYLLAWSEAGRPTRCVAVEDSLNGIRSAESAGLRVLTVHRDLGNGWYAQDLFAARGELLRWRDGVS